jgi:hypothetical protein
LLLLLFTTFLTALLHLPAVMLLLTLVVQVTEVNETLVDDAGLLSQVQPAASPPLCSSLLIAAV